jgi:hypothetical protein
MLKKLSKFFSGKGNSAPSSAFLPSSLNPSSAEAFENGLLHWLRTDMGLKPVARSGTNTRYWAFAHGGQEVHLAVIGQQHNTSTPPEPGIDWILRIEEPEPLAFVTVMERHFVANSCFKRKMPGGTLRVQFKSTDLLSQSE